MIPSVSYREFAARQLFRSEVPIVVTDALVDWNLDDIWTVKSVTNLVRDRIVPVRIRKGPKFSYPLGTPEVPEIRQMKFSLAAKIITDPPSTESIYVMQVPISKKLPELLQNLVVPDWIAAAGNPDMQFWFGRDTTSPLHFDNANNFFAQLLGKKRFVLFSPRDSWHLYPKQLDGYEWHTSPVDVDLPDKKQFPNFVNATRLEFVLNKGDALFLPAYWWHHVTALGISISISMWCGSRFEQLIHSPNALRLLCKYYEEDRLKLLKKQVLEPNGLDFVSAAHKLLSDGETWASSLVILAAFDELLEGWSTGTEIARRPGCPMAELPYELDKACSSIAAKYALSDSLRLALAKVPGLASQASNFDRPEVKKTDVTAIIEMVSEMRSGELTTR
jgi:hypothetical protein